MDKKRAPVPADVYIRYLNRLLASKKINTPHGLAEIVEGRSKNAKVAVRNLIKFLIRKGYRTKSQLIDF